MKHHNAVKSQIGYYECISWTQLAAKYIDIIVNVRHHHQRKVHITARACFVFFEFWRVGIWSIKLWSLSVPHYEFFLIFWFVEFYCQWYMDRSYTICHIFNYNEHVYVAKNDVNIYCTSGLLRVRNRFSFRFPLPQDFFFVFLSDLV